MSDRPIIFSAPMVRALLDGRKTQTRRILGTRGHCNIFAPGEWTDSYVMDAGDASWRERDTPYAAGDRLWVREAHYLTDDGDSEYAVCAVDDDAVRDHLAAVDRLPAYFSDKIKARHRKLRPSIHMPRWASRLTLIVTDVRVQRLQEISEDDAVAEGVEPICDHGVGNRHLHAIAFEQLWNRLHGPDAWAANPWVAAITFTVHRANIDALAPSDALAIAGAV